MAASVSPSDDALRAQIRADVERRARARSGLSWHAVVFVLVNALLVFLNERFTPGFQWFVFPLVAWGIGLAFHAYAVHGGEQRRADIEAEVERELARRTGR